MANDKKKDKKIVYGIAILLLIIIIFAISFNRNKKQQSDNFEVQQEKTEEQIIQMEKDNITDKLQGMEERDRMEFYFGMFLNYVEEAEYKRAYDLLYPEFKENYFPTLEAFTEYAQKTFPEMAEITYENIERNGDIYVLWIGIADVLNDKRTDEKKKMNIVIQEKDYNDFVMSFSVI